MAKASFPAKPADVVDKSRYKYSRLRRQFTLQAACDGQVLRPWQRAIAIWFVAQVTPPKPAAVAEYARSYLGQTISQASINRLVSNPAFHAALQQYEEEVTTRAKAFAETRLHGAIEKHFDAIDELYKEKRWDHLVKYTNPLMERVWPTSDGPRLPAQIVQVVIGGSFAATQLHAAAPVAFEIVDDSVPPEAV